MDKKPAVPFGAAFDLGESVPGGGSTAGFTGERDE